jgi:hypothetical protein
MAPREAICARFLKFTTAVSSFTDTDAVPRVSSSTTEIYYCCQQRDGISASCQQLYYGCQQWAISLRIQIAVSSDSAKELSLRIQIATSS